MVTSHWNVMFLPRNYVLAMKTVKIFATQLFFKEKLEYPGEAWLSEFFLLRR